MPVQIYGDSDPQTPLRKQQSGGCNNGHAGEECPENQRASSFES